jgi:hypothetical protein
MKPKISPFTFKQHFEVHVQMWRRLSQYINIYNYILLSIYNINIITTYSISNNESSDVDDDITFLAFTNTQHRKSRNVRNKKTIVLKTRVLLIKCNYSFDHFKQELFVSNIFQF